MTAKGLFADKQRLLGVLDRALETLGQTTGLAGRIVAPERAPGKDRGTDAFVDIDVDGAPHRYVVRLRTRVDRPAIAGLVKAELDQHGEQGLLFAPYITPTIAKHCRKLGLAFLDAAGNAYVKLPGLYIYITGEKPQGPLATTAVTARAGATPTALRVVFALLCNPELLNAPYREIVEAAGVALGAVGRVFADLEERGLITGGKKKHDRRFLEPERLFEEWVTTYPIKLRPKLNPRRFKAENIDWWRTTQLHELGDYWGGEVAAARLTNYLKPATGTIYVKPQRAKETLRRLAAEHRLRADPNGNLEILDTFWNLPGDPAQPDVVPPVLAYADLVATLDPRNLEAAGLIREQYLTRALRQP